MDHGNFTLSGRVKLFRHFEEDRTISRVVEPHLIFSFFSLFAIGGLLSHDHST